MSSSELVPTSLFQQKLQQWLTFDTQMRQHQQSLKALREKKEDITTQLTTVLDKKQLTNVILNCGDARIKYYTCKETQPLTFRLLETCLHEIMTDPQQVEQVISYIKQKRDVKVVTDLKRL